MSGMQPGRSAVLAPGGNNNAEVPLLMYARLAVKRRGASARSVTWDLAEGSGIGRHRQMVALRVAAAVDELTLAMGAAPLVIGKSLGSLAASVVADRGLAAVWFTPLLTDEATVAALRRATGAFLLAGGTADPYWDPDLILAHVATTFASSARVRSPRRALRNMWQRQQATVAVAVTA